MYIERERKIERKVEREGGIELELSAKNQGEEEPMPEYFSTFFNDFNVLQLKKCVCVYGPACAYVRLHTEIDTITTYIHNTYVRVYVFKHMFLFISICEFHFFFHFGIMFRSLLCTLLSKIQKRLIFTLIITRMPASKLQVKMKLINISI